jgi:hypothetical protein
MQQGQNNRSGSNNVLLSDEMEEEISIDDEGLQLFASTVEMENVWTDLFYNPFARLSSFPSNLLLCDIDGDGENHIISFQNNSDSTSLPSGIVYIKHGKNSYDFPLNEEPDCITCIYENPNSDDPLLCIAVGSSILLLKKNVQVGVIELPKYRLNEMESQCWINFFNGESSGSTLKLEKPQRGLQTSGVETLSGELTKLESLGITLGFSSITFLKIMESCNGNVNEETLKNVINDVRKQVFEEPDYVTCMCPLYQYSENEVNAKSYLVVGTERKKIYIFNLKKILKEFETSSPPCSLSTKGTFVKNYIIVVACRNGGIHLFSDSQSKLITFTEFMPLKTLISFEQNVIIACMDNSISCFDTNV